MENYIAKSRSGKYSYRRRIPAAYQDLFFKNASSGATRGREWKASLKTNDMSVALTRAGKENARFEAQLAWAKQQKLLENCDHQASFISYLKRINAHPEQAPRLAERAKLQDWMDSEPRTAMLKQLHSYALETFEYHPATGEEYPSELSQDAFEQIKFMEGRVSTITDRLRLTLGDAGELYITNRYINTVDRVGSKQKAKIQAVRRAVMDFALYVGVGDVDVGLNHNLASIRRDDVRAYLSQNLQDDVNSAATISRRLSDLNAMFNHAKRERAADDDELKLAENPFSGLPAEARRLHDTRKRRGKIQNNDGRAWSPEELSAFEIRLPHMNRQLRLVAQIAIHTGARLHDIVGLMTRDVQMTPVPFIMFRHNSLRDISKDSIERNVPVFGGVLEALRDYLSDQKDEAMFPSYSHIDDRGADAASNALKKHLDSVAKQLDVLDRRRLKFHGLRHTLQAKFDAAGINHQNAAYIIGWRNQQTVGLQDKYRQGILPQQLIDDLKSAHEQTDWAIR